MLRSFLVPKLPGYIKKLQLFVVVSLFRVDSLSRYEATAAPGLFGGGQTWTRAPGSGPGPSPRRPCVPAAEMPTYLGCFGPTAQECRSAENFGTERGRPRLTRNFKAGNHATCDRNGGRAARL